MGKKEIASFSSFMHGKARLYEDRIVVKKRTSVFIPFVGKSEKTIYLQQLVGVTVKKGGLSSGHIHFATGGAESQKGYFSNTESDSSIVFGAQSNGSALRFKQAIENQLSKINSHGTISGNSLSAADEIEKFKSLLDDGVITQKEFDIKKKELLR